MQGAGAGAGCRVQGAGASGWALGSGQKLYPNSRYGRPGRPARCTLHTARCTLYTVPLQYRPPSGHSTSGTGGEVRVDNDSEQEQEQEQEPGHGAGGGQVGRVPGRLAVGGGQEEAARADRAQGAGGGGDCFQTCFSSLQWPTSCPAPALTHPPHYHSLLPRGARQCTGRHNSTF